MGIETGFPGERRIVIPQQFLDLIQNDPLTGDLYIHSLGYIAHGRHHFVERPSGDDAYLFIYCVWGSGSIRIRQQTIPIKANQYIVLPKQIPLSYGAENDDPWSIYWIKFDGEKGKIFARNMEAPVTVPPSINMRIEQRIELFENLYGVLCGTLTLDRLNYANLAFAHLIASFRFLTLFETINEQPRHIEGIVNRVTHFMNENIDRKLTIDEISRYAGYNPSYLYRQFIRQTSMAPIEYFNHLKINKATVYLLKTSMTVSQIAAKLGFGSADHFSRTFKHLVGISPSEFRKQDFRL